MGTKLKAKFSNATPCIHMFLDAGQRSLLGPGRRIEEHSWWVDGFLTRFFWPRFQVMWQIRTTHVTPSSVSALLHCLHGPGLLTVRQGGQELCKSPGLLQQQWATTIFNICPKELETHFGICKRTLPITAWAVPFFKGKVFTHLITALWNTRIKWHNKWEKPRSLSKHLFITSFSTGWDNT